MMIGAILKQKMGFALNVLDGNSRTAEFCTSVLLNKFGLLSNDRP
jgi:hypothetical protein